VAQPARVSGAPFWLESVRARLHQGPYVPALSRRPARLPCAECPAGLKCPPLEFAGSDIPRLRGNAPHFDRIQVAKDSNAVLSLAQNARFVMATQALE